MAHQKSRPDEHLKICCFCVMTLKHQLFMPALARTRQSRELGMWAADERAELDWSGAEDFRWIQ
jgi:hypothetical protein